MTALVRNSLRDLINGANSAPHPGLLLTRGMVDWVEPKNEGQNSEESQGQGKARLIEKIAGQNFSPLYKYAFERWKKLTDDRHKFKAEEFSLTSRMFIGLATGGSIETGVTTHHTYGMPMIPGSAVKGAARAYAKEQGLDVEYLAALFGEDEDDAASAGRVAGAGCLVWHDAWWSPDSKKPPFIPEVVTVHHQEYYNGVGEATDFDSPVPNAQIAVQGSFLFVIEGPTNWAGLAMTILRHALADRGLGAKRAAGYGYFMKSDSAQQSKTPSIEPTEKWIENQVVTYDPGKKGISCPAGKADSKQVGEIFKVLDPKFLNSLVKKKRGIFDVKVRQTGNMAVIVEIRPSVA